MRMYPPKAIAKTKTKLTFTIDPLELSASTVYVKVKSDGSVKKVQAAVSANGKTKKNTLKKDRDYTISSDGKTLEFKGNYTGSVKVDEAQKS